MYLTIHQRDRLTLDLVRNGQTVRTIIAPEYRTYPCPSCGAATLAERHYVGGTGYQLFRVCSKDRTHKAVKV